MSFASNIIREAEPYDINQMAHLLEELFSIKDDFTFNEFTQRQGLLMVLDDNEKRCIMIAESGDSNHRDVQRSTPCINSGRGNICID